MGEFKGLLEDLSFPYIYPKEFEKVKGIRSELLASGEAYLEKNQHPA